MFLRPIVFYFSKIDSRKQLSKKPLVGFFFLFLKVNPVKWSQFNFLIAITIRLIEMDKTKNAITGIGIDLTLVSNANSRDD